MSKGWGRPFDDPIKISERKQLVTVRDAAAYMLALSPKERRLPEWQAAAEALLVVVERNGPTMLARIGMLRALNRKR